MPAIVPNTGAAIQLPQLSTAFTPQFQMPQWRPADFMAAYQYAPKPIDSTAVANSVVGAFNQGSALGLERAKWDSGAAQRQVANDYSNQEHLDFLGQRAVGTANAQLPLANLSGNLSARPGDLPDNPLPLANLSRDGSTVGTGASLGGGSDDLGDTITSTATGYHPVSPDDPAYKMEGGSLDAQGNPISTLDAFRRGETSFVTAAVDKDSPLFGKTAYSPELDAPVRFTDTGSAFKGKGTSRVDIARDDAAGANSEENNGKLTFNLANTSPGDVGNQVSLGSTPALATPPVVASRPLAGVSLPRTAMLGYVTPPALPLANGLSGAVATPAVNALPLQNVSREVPTQNSAPLANLSRTVPAVVAQPLAHGFTPIPGTLQDTLTRLHGNGALNVHPDGSVSFTGTTPMNPAEMQYKQAQIALDAARQSNEERLSNRRQTAVINQVGPDGVASQALVDTGTGDIIQSFGAKPTVAGKNGAGLPKAIITEAVRYGVPTEGKTADEVGQEIEDKQVQTGVIPPNQRPVAEKLQSIITADPDLKDYRKMRQAYSAFSAGYNNPNAGGFSDMALTEGAQRILNPGATVRQGTIKNMQQAAGWLQSLDPTFQWNSAIQGNKFSDAARGRLKGLIDGVYNDATANVQPTLDGMKSQAQMFGVKNPDKFVDNVFKLPVHSDGTASSNSASSSTASTAPSAVPPANASTVSGSRANPVTVASAEQYASLPSGSYYVDSSGKLARKP